MLSRSPVMPLGILVLAGVDPTHGAGLDADREGIACAARGSGVSLRALAIATAYTQQDGRRVQAIGARESEQWQAEGERALREGVAALKTGLLPGAAHVRAAARICDRAGVPTVVDPLIEASGGEVFLDAAGCAALLEELLPLGVILTPNLPEAARLTGRDPRELAGSLEARLSAAQDLLARGARAVLLKGGHADDDRVLDLCASRDAEPVWLERPQVPQRRLHGSGCRYASFVAARLALGDPLESAARAAGEWLSRLILERGTPR
jgi:hydroxymethylpyrimidine/phosphomethylpyrimidine kinase